MKDSTSTGFSGVRGMLVSFPWPTWILYGLALVCSLVTLNFHVGFTIYLSRILVGLFGVALLVICAGGRASEIQMDRRYLILFAGMLLSQGLSLIAAADKMMGIRQMFIYVSLMALFLTVVVLGDKPEKLAKAIMIYLGMGVFHSVFGVEQVVGYFMGWTPLNALMVNVPAATRNMRIGTFVSTDIGLPRSSGFHVDPNNFAGYMVGIVLMSLVLIAWNRRKILPRLGLVFGGMGLTLSLSRSGFLTMAAGCFVLLPLLLHARLWSRRAILSMITLGSAGIVGGVLIFLLFGAIGQGGIGQFDILGSICGRMSRGVSSDSHTVYESTHLRSKLAALHAWKAHPITGVGAGNTWYDKKFEWEWTGAHSHHLDVLARTGTVGFVWELAFMLLVAGVMWKGLQASFPGSLERALLAGLLTTFLSLLAGNLLYHYYLSDFVWFLMGCGVALSRGVIRQRALPGPDGAGEALA